jgi:hypothetical protein
MIEASQNVKAFNAAKSLCSCAPKLSRCQGLVPRCPQTHPRARFCRPSTARQ